MEKKETKMQIPKITLDDLFTTQEQRDNAKLEKIIDMDDFPNHPFKVIDNEEMELMKESIIDNGVLVLAIVRPKADGKYEMISGHRRKFASELAFKETMPCIVRDSSDDEAIIIIIIIIMVDSNMQRKEILPSERAFAYKMKLETLNHQGKRNDLTSGQVGQKLNSRKLLAETSEDSARQIQRYIRLTNLIPELLDKVDEKIIAFNPAVELSYLKEEEQENIEEEIVPEFTKKKKSKVNTFDIHPEISMNDRNQYRITDNNLGVDTTKNRFSNNIEAIKVLKKCEEENRFATKEKQEILSKYVGWRGLSQAFKEDDSSWSNENLWLINRS